MARTFVQFAQGLFTEMPTSCEPVLLTFDSGLDDRECATKAFERHIEEVKKRVPAEKLLVYEVKQGWGPLCGFLEVEAPQEPFPHLNERDQFPRMMRQVRLKMLSELAPSA